ELLPAAVCYCPAVAARRPALAACHPALAARRPAALTVAAAAATRATAFTPYCPRGCAPPNLPAMTSLCCTGGSGDGSGGCYSHNRLECA
ncbi:unnamed protein product, partial [Closterium sp. NIES-53]